MGSEMETKLDEYARMGREKKKSNKEKKYKKEQNGKVAWQHVTKREEVEMKQEKQNRRIEKQWVPKDGRERESAESLGYWCKTTSKDSPLCYMATHTDTPTNSVRAWVQQCCSMLIS